MRVAVFAVLFAVACSPAALPQSVVDWKSHDWTDRRLPQSGVVRDAIIVDETGSRGQEGGDEMKFAAIIIWTLIYGALWNILGWLGNNILLGSVWDAVSAQATPGFEPPYSGLAREGMTLVPDFIYAFGFVWMFAQMRTQTIASAVFLALVLELFVIVVYLAMVTSGFLPWPVAVQTSVLALLIFVVTAPILPMVLRRSQQLKSA